MCSERQDFHRVRCSEQAMAGRESLDGAGKARSGNRGGWGGRVRWLATRKAWGGKIRAGSSESRKAFVLDFGGMGIPGMRT